MKKKPASHFFALTLTLLISLTCFAANIKGQSKPAKLPPGNWTLSAGPASGPGYDSAPVDVYSVTTDADKGLTVTQVSLLNRSSKDVTAVKLHWILKEQEQGSVLKEGNTPLVDVDIQAGKTESLSYPVASFARMYKALMKGATLSGNYRLEISVSEVVYAEAPARVR